MKLTSPEVDMLTCCHLPPAAVFWWFSCSNLDGRAKRMCTLFSASVVPHKHSKMSKGLVCFSLESIALGAEQNKTKTKKEDKHALKFGGGISWKPNDAEKMRLCALFLAFNTHWGAASHSYNKAWGPDWMTGQEMIKFSQTTNWQHRTAEFVL